MSSSIKEHEYVVLGAGSAGLTVAIGLAKLGKDVLVIAEEIGGDCTNTGCVPSKKFLQLAHQYRNSPDTNHQKDLHSNIFKHIQATIQDILAHDDHILSSNNIKLIQARAVFTGPHELYIKDKKQTVRFQKAIIATGTSPFVVPIDGLPETKLLTNETVFNLQQIPSKLVVIGGGPIGAELATAFALFGSKVTLVLRSSFLPHDPPEAAALVRTSLEQLGVKMIDGVYKQSYDKEKGHLVLYDKQGKRKTRVESPDFVLQAIGRTPNTQIGLEEAGVAYGPKGVAVDDKFCTSQKHIQALGDVTASPKFTHLAYNQGVNLIKGLVLPISSYRQPPLPWVTFTDPPIASVGMTQEKGRVKMFAIDLAQSDRAKIDEKETMKAFVYIDMLSGTVKGASIVGEPAEPLINMFTVMILKKMKAFELTNLITPYPTYANGLNSLNSLFLTEFKTHLKENAFSYFKDHWQRIAAGFFWIVIAGSLFWYFASVGFDTQRVALLLNDLLLSDLGIVIFFAAYVLRATLSLPATLLSILGGSIYGFWWGILLTILASNTSSAFAYYLGKTVFASTEEATTTSGFRAYIQKNTFEAVLIARLTYVPYDLVSYIAGGLRVPFWQFMGATALGALPGTVAIVSFGAGIENILDFENFRLQPEFFGIGLGVMVVSILFSKWLKRKKSVRVKT
jgi:pyruvate/2-oxoglutarate dehydrogenase complex dihydrolipoamide dehydrogenase (E3) component/uncharacterized membrane protein YdjX (TVP38/TMEM64 family)